jgi:hypothetical protein
MVTTLVRTNTQLESLGASTFDSAAVASPHARTSRTLAVGTSAASRVTGDRVHGSFASRLISSSRDFHVRSF